MFSLVFEAAAAAVLRDLPATGGIAVYSVFPSVWFPSPICESRICVTELKVSFYQLTPNFDHFCMNAVQDRRLNFIRVGRQIFVAG